MKQFFCIFLLSLSIIFTSSSTLLGQSGSSGKRYASQERHNAAVGHYSRARALLVEALAEFEIGRKLARPDLLVDSEEWRLSIISRTEELNRILDPQPRVTRSGVRFNADSLKIKREKDQPEAVTDGAKSSNTFGEDNRKNSAKLSSPQTAKVQKSTRINQPTDSGISDAVVTSSELANSLAEESSPDTIKAKEDATDSPKIVNTPAKDTKEEVKSDVKVEDKLPEPVLPVTEEPSPSPSLVPNKDKNDLPPNQAPSEDSSKETKKDAAIKDESGGSLEERLKKLDLEVEGGQK